MMRICMAIWGLRCKDPDTRQRRRKNLRRRRSCAGRRRSKGAAIQEQEARRRFTPYKGPRIFKLSGATSAWSEVTMIGWVVLGLIVLVIIVVIGMYNSLVR